MVQDSQADPMENGAGPVAGFLQAHLVVFLIFTVPFFSLNLAIFRFDYGVTTLGPLVAVLIAGGPLVAGIAKLAASKHRPTAIQVLVLTALAAGVWTILFLINRPFWASDSVLGAVLSTLAILLETTLAYLALKQTLKNGKTARHHFAWGLVLVGAGLGCVSVDIALWHVFQAGVALLGGVACISGNRNAEPAPIADRADVDAVPITHPRLKTGRGAYMHDFSRAVAFLGVSSAFGAIAGPFFWTRQGASVTLPLIFGTCIAACGILLLAKARSSRVALGGCVSALIAFAGTWALLAANPVLTVPIASVLAMLAGASLGFWNYDIIISAGEYPHGRGGKGVGPAARLHGFLLLGILGVFLGYWLIGYVYDEIKINLTSFLAICTGVSLLIELLRPFFPHHERQV